MEVFNVTVSTGFRGTIFEGLPHLSNKKTLIILPKDTPTIDWVTVIVKSIQMEKEGIDNMYVFTSDLKAPYPKFFGIKDIQSIFESDVITKNTLVIFDRIDFVNSSYADKIKSSTFVSILYNEPTRNVLKYDNSNVYIPSSVSVIENISVNWIPSTLPMVISPLSLLNDSIESLIKIRKTLRVNKFYTTDTDLAFSEVLGTEDTWFNNSDKKPVIMPIPEGKPIKLTLKSGEHIPLDLYTKHIAYLSNITIHGVPLNAIDSITIMVGNTKMAVQQFPFIEPDKLFQSLNGSPCAFPLTSPNYHVYFIIKLFSNEINDVASITCDIHQSNKVLTENLLLQPSYLFTNYDTFCYNSDNIYKLNLNHITTRLVINLKDSINLVRTIHLNIPLTRGITSFAFTKLTANMYILDFELNMNSGIKKTINFSRLDEAYLSFNSDKFKGFYLEQTYFNVVNAGICYGLMYTS